MIAYQIKCKDLGFDFCNFMLTGNSESELKRKFFFHTALDHDKEFEFLNEEQKMELHFKMKRLIDGQSGF